MKIHKRRVEVDADALRDSGIPRRYWALDADDYFGRPKALEAIADYTTHAKQAFRNGAGLLLLGADDAGKTFLLSLALRGLMMRGFNVAYMTLDDISEVMVRPEEAKRFNVELLKPDFVALDDCDSTQGVPEAALRKFVRIRSDNGLPFLIASSLCTDEGELDLDLFAAAFTKTAARIKNLCRVVHCSCDAFRIRRHYEKIKEAIEE